MMSRMTCMCIRHAKKSVFVKPNPILGPKTSDESVLEFEWQWQ
jgi:hypothetical protein